MKLYSGDLSPYAARIRMQIYAKGIADITFELPATFMTLEYRDENPIGRVPVLDRRRRPHSRVRRHRRVSGRPLSRALVCWAPRRARARISVRSPASATSICSTTCSCWRARRYAKEPQSGDRRSSGGSGRAQHQGARQDDRHGRFRVLRAPDPGRLYARARLLPDGRTRCRPWISKALRGGTRTSPPTGRRSRGTSTPPRSSSRCSAAWSSVSKRCETVHSQHGWRPRRRWRPKMRPTKAEQLSQLSLMGRIVRELAGGLPSSR